jgi:tRNA pseudouridine55 synthase
MLHGIINIKKEKGFTSHDVVAKMRGITKQKKIGHTGTLDPDATGVLPVCLGKATKVCELLTDKDKTYRAVIELGRTTDTYDATGQTLLQQDVSVTDDEVCEVIRSFVKTYEQIPPMYSAIKVGGKKLYELARNGIEVERKGRTVTISSIVIEQVNLPYVTVEVTCSKGTYIRSLCYDIGQAIGCGGCMYELERTRVGRYRIEDAYTLSQVEEKMKAGQIEEILQPVDDVFAGYPALCVKELFHKLLYNGNRLQPECFLEEQIVPADAYRVYDSNGIFTGLYAYSADTQDYKPVKMFL